MTPDAGGKQAGQGQRLAWLRRRLELSSLGAALFLAALLTLAVALTHDLSGFKYVLKFSPTAYLLPGEKFGVLLLSLIVTPVFFALARRIRADVSGFLVRHARGLIVGVLVIAALSLPFYAYRILQVFPNSADEYSFVFMAETLGQGRLWNDLHPEREFFSLGHIIEKQGKWISRYPLGWPLTLVLARIIHLPRGLVNPILGLLTLWLLFVMARRLYGLEAALIASLFLALSSFFVANSASLFSNPLCCLTVLLYYYFGLRYLDGKGRVFALLAGVSIGLAFLTRYYTGLVCALPLAGALVWRERFRAAGSLALIFLGSLPSVLAVCLYNYKVTGSPFVMVMSWDTLTFPIGFHTGYPFWKRIVYLIQHFVDLAAWTSPPLVAVYLLLFCLAWRKRELRIMDLVFPTLVLGYLLFGDFGGNQYGPRYYYEAFPFFVLSVACWTTRLGRLIQADDFRKAVASSLVAGVFISLVTAPFLALGAHEIVSERTDVYRLVEERGLRNAVVFLGSGSGIRYGMTPWELARNGTSLERSVIYAHDRGPDNAKLVQYFPDRSFYVYTRPEDQVRGQLKAVELGSPPGRPAEEAPRAASPRSPAQK